MHISIHKPSEKEIDNFLTNDNSQSIFQTEMRLSHILFSFSGIGRVKWQIGSYVREIASQLGHINVEIIFFIRGDFFKNIKNTFLWIAYLVFLCRVMDNLLNLEIIISELWSI